MSFPATESDVLAIAADWLREGYRVALATVVKTAGSAPRQGGSHIVVRGDGAFAGSVSAGCVEGAVIEAAQAALGDGRHRTLRFGASDAGVFEAGLLCGGEIEILIEPILSDMQRAILEQLMAARREGRVLVRALEMESGAEKLIDPAMDSSALGLAAAAAAGEDKSRRVTIEGRTWLLTVYNTPWELVLVGAVHIAQALAVLAEAAGYRVRVIDPRAPYATLERFPNIALQREWPDEALAHRPLTDRSALIALAHDPKLDDAALTVALRSPAFYVGALGSVRTQARRLARLEAQGFSKTELLRIRGPVGLAIGARSPAEIAIAILAELVQRRRMPGADQRIAGVVLAAGMSTRMGQNKLILPLHGKPLVRHAVEAALAAALDPVIVVIGHGAAVMRDALGGLPVHFVQNDAFAEGLSTSLRIGIKSVPPTCDGAMVLLGDMPNVSPELIERIIAAFDPVQSCAICVATAKGERGHPVLWGRQLFREMEELRGDTGARALMARHAELVCEVEAGDDTPLADIDTPEAFEAHAR